MIEIINVSKKFRIWEDRSRDLKETTINFLRGKKRSFRDLWALRGINLKIKEGETVAFIGENGSGKSTLLKLLAGVYVPDEGKIATQGKISSLLELGVGFHPDLTGEENIYLNGAMLGFDSDDMRERFDEVVSFSEIGDFIYSPIRTYSSGMLMRLGFSVAMCVNPDILLIDEVLAVGDEAFQKKCLKRLEEFKSAGKTIVIVSHGLELIRKFCGRVILLQEGKVIIDGTADRTIDKYHAILSNKERPRDLDEIVEMEKTYYAQTVSEISISEEKGESKEIKEKEEIEEIEEKEEREEKGEDEGKGPQKPKYERYGTFEAEIVDVALKNEKGEETNIFNSGERMSIFLKIRFHRDIEDPIIGFYIRKCEEDHFLDIYGTNTRWQDIELGLIKIGEEMEVNFSHSLVVPEGTYYLLVAVADSEETKFYDWQENIRTFTVKSEDTSYTGIMNLNSQIVVNHFV